MTMKRNSSSHRLFSGSLTVLPALILISIMGGLVSAYQNTISFPWTPPNSATGQSLGRTGGKCIGIDNTDNKREMALTLRDFMKNCDGKCFYYPEGCSRETLSCEMAVSVLQQRPHCEVEEGQEKAEIDAILCEVEKEERFYKVAVMRLVKKPSCEKGSRACEPKEFVAVSLNEKATSLDDAIWYVCLSSHQTVSTWTRVENDTLRIRNTFPFYNGGAGVLWSKNYYREEDGTFVCQFMLSTEHMYLNKSNANVQNKIKDGAKLSVKVAQGRFRKTPAGDDAPAFDSKEPDEEYNIHPFQDELDLDCVAIKPPTTTKVEEDKNVNDRINKLFNLCKYKDYAACFTPNNKDGCRKRKNCPIIVIIQRIAEDTLKFHVIVQEFEKNKLIVHALKPYGWGSVGFVQSHDSSAGALTLSCTAKGNESKSMIAYKNEAKSNMKVEGWVQDQMKDKDFAIFQSESSTNKFLCTWTLPSKVNIEYSKRENGNSVPVTQEYDFTNRSYRVLLATGSTLQKEHLTMHKYREILNTEFKIADLKVKATLGKSDKGFCVKNNHLHLLSFLTTFASYYLLRL